MTQGPTEAFLRYESAITRSRCLICLLRCMDGRKWGNLHCLESRRSNLLSSSTTPCILSNIWKRGAFTHSPVSMFFLLGNDISFFISGVAEEAPIRGPQLSPVAALPDCIACKIADRLGSVALERPSR